MVEMTHKYVVWCGLFALLALQPSMAEATSSKEPKQVITITYKIKKGDTLQKIAQDHKVSVKHLKQWNKGLDPRALKIGQRLKIAVINPEWTAWKQGKKKRKVPKRSAKTSAAGSSGASGAEPPRQLAAEASSPTERFEALGVSRPSKSLPPAPKVKSSEASSVSAVSVTSLIFDGEALPVVTSREELAGLKPESKVLYVPEEQGENLGSVALKFRLDPEALQYWNDLSSLELKPGEPLLLQSDGEKPVNKELLPVTHRIRKGDSFQKIAKRYGVSVKQLKRWNKKVNPRKLRIGRTVTLYLPAKDGVSRSHGSANRGQLHNGVALESTTGLHVRTVANSYGTERVVRLLKGVAYDVKARWPNAPDMIVGDISYRHGGKIKRHSSHQSGRDADISFFHRANVELPDFRDMNEENFDAARNWHVFKTLIDLGEVEYIFIDYPLQRILHEYALSIGYTEEELAPLIQYPEPSSSNAGIIRHVRGHDDHWHIRFSCGPLDSSCR